MQSITFKANVSSADSTLLNQHFNQLISKISALQSDRAIELSVQIRATNPINQEKQNDLNYKIV